MKVITILDRLCSTNNYLIIYKNEAVLVDASVCVEEVEKALEGAKLKGILLTHSHFDHIFKLDEIREKFDCSVYIHEKGYSSLFDADKNISSTITPFEVKNASNIIKIKNDEVLDFFTFPIKVIHTPGHSHCSVCYEIGDYLFTGDTLFSACIGRNDFWHSNEEDQQKSLKKLLALSPKIKYFSGHGHSFDYNRLVKVINKYKK